MKILCLGVGAIGSHLVANLCADLSPEHDITIVDFDVVQERNLRNQFYTPKYVGISKVEALQDLCYEWFEREIHIINDKLTPGNFQLLRQYDLAIDCFDNYGARLLTQSLHEKEFDLLHCGFSQDMTFAIEWAETYKVPSDITSGFDICTEPGAGSFIRMVASLSSQVVQEFLSTGKKKEFIGNKFSLTEIT